MPVIRIGLDVAKNVFQAHGGDEHGQVVLRKQLRRHEVLTFFASLPPCLIGIEACSASHYWARELTALGHQVRMMPARYVKPYVQRGKNDALDAAAICEAVSRPTMRFAAIKSVEQQSALTLHRAREILAKQETMLANLIRGCLGEFGIVAPLGIRRIAELVGIIKDETDSRIPPHARIAMTAVATSSSRRETDRRSSACRCGPEDFQHADLHSDLRFPTWKPSRHSRADNSRDEGGGARSKAIRGYPSGPRRGYHS